MRLICCRRFCRAEIGEKQDSMTIGSDVFHVACGSSELKERSVAEKLRAETVAKLPRPVPRPQKVNPNWPFRDRHFHPA